VVNVIILVLVAGKPKKPNCGATADKCCRNGYLIPRTFPVGIDYGATINRRYLIVEDEAIIALDLADQNIDAVNLDIHPANTAGLSDQTGLSCRPPEAASSYHRPACRTVESAMPLVCSLLTTLRPPWQRQRIVHIQHALPEDPAIMRQLPIRRLRRRRPPRKNKPGRDSQ
jgi:hypothetical protein